MVSLADSDALDRIPLDFDDALLRRGVPALLLEDKAQARLDVLRDAWARLHPAKVEPSASPTIPRILHQVWLGSPLPEPYRSWREEWMRRHPEWEHRLWTEREIAELDFPTRDLYESTRSIGMRSDLVRAEILHRFGGLYVDTDYRCFGSLDPFHFRYDFYGTARSVVGFYLRLPFMAPPPCTVCNSLMAAAPGHPIVGSYLARVRRVWRHGPELPTSRFERWVSRLGAFDLEDVKRTMGVTYSPFQSAVVRHMKRHPDDRVVVFPPSCFNPEDKSWDAGRFALPMYWSMRLAALRRFGFRRPPHYVDVQPHSLTSHIAYGVWARKRG